MEPKDVQVMFNIIIEICERTFLLNQCPNSEFFDEKLHQLPSFIESLARVCNQLDEKLPEGSANTLEKLVVLAIDCYPRLFKKHGRQICVSIAHLFIAIQIGKPNMYCEFIGRIVYQSLIRIFSYRTSYFLQAEKVNACWSTLFI